VHIQHVLTFLICFF